MAKMTRRKIREFHPLMVYVILIAFTVIISGFLRLLDVQATHFTINNITMDLSPQTEAVTSLFSLSGLKYIFTSTVSNFANFTVLANLIIILMGISVMDKSGFLQTAITLTTKRLKKKTVTFIFILLCVLSSLFGDLPYLVFMPLGALLFYYGKRNPSIGLISSFAALSCGSGINAIFSANDSNILNNTLLAAHTIDPNYNVTKYGFLFIMFAAVILISYLITIITENIIVKKLPKYEFTESELEEDIVTKEEQKGMKYALISAGVYLILFLYSVIPGLPLSGALLDNSQELFINKLFSINSFFYNGFVFIITMLFVILGLFYGIGVKTIKNHKDFFNNLGHSLDDIGNVLVMIFLASAFISIFKRSNIGNVILTFIGNIISNSGFNGLSLILLAFLGIAIGNLFVPSSMLKWSILSSSVVPTLMNNGISPAFTQVIYRFAETSTMNLTPLFAYFIVYLALLEKYNQGENKIKLGEAIKYQMPYTVVVAIALLVIIVLWYVIGIPMGINSLPVI